ncbi:DUF3240 family protein [Nitrobacter sp.]|uniref:DUF3240 family protein n=1 Tax=Nitrobacter sp. TaxID=29420 RepID=UPI003F64B286
MTEMLLTFHCALCDCDVVAETIRTRTEAPLYICQKTVRGKDFDDASTAERVVGLLRRNTIELIVETDAVTGLVEAVTQAKRDLPVRWHAVSVLMRGRVA